MKIGGSMSKGGIKSTMSFYTDSQQGNPGPNRFCIHLLIEEELKKQKNVELGLVMNKKIKAETMGLKSKKNIYVSAFKESEDFCKQEYHEFYGKYPPWNFQENGTKYPSRLIKLHNEYIKKRI